MKQTCISLPTIFLMRKMRKFIITVAENESVFAVSKLPKQHTENKWILSKYCAKTIAEVIEKT